MNKHYHSHSHKHNISTYSSLSIPLLPIMIILKLTGLIKLSWWWVIGIPILVPIGILTFILLCVGLFFDAILLWDYISKVFK